MSSSFKQMGDSIEYTANTILRRCHAIVLAFTIFNALDHADAFSIQGCFPGLRGYQCTKPIAQNVFSATKSIHCRNKRITKRCTLLNEQSLASVQNEINGESNVLLRSEHEGYTCQSQAIIPDNQCANSSSTQPQTSQPAMNYVATENYNPISDLQMMTLKSKIMKYMVSSSTTLSKNRIIILWRNLLNDTPEIHGFPISFLAEQMKIIMQSVGRTSNTTTALISTELALQQITTNAEIDWDLVSPYLDAYTFEMGGGVTGLVYGVVGVADGTQICTSPVGSVQSTIPQNYILTGDGCLYELGRPAFANDSLSQAKQKKSPYSLSGTTKEWFSNGQETASLMVENARATVSEKTSDDTVINSDLWQLAGVTTIVLSGAMAMESLSHHLTVNVFWV